MENRRQITEDDLRETEALIARSYYRVKTSVIQKPAKVLVPISQTISEHPLEAAATAVGGGIAAYGIARMIAPKHDSDSHKKRHCKKKKSKKRSDPFGDILSALVPLAIPYLTAYLEKYLTPPRATPDKHSQPKEKNE